MRLLCLLALLMAPLTALAAEPCEPCTLPGGVYHAAAPPDWDGLSPLRLLLFLHGWRNQGSEMIGDPHIADTAHRLGFLLVAPDGQDDPGGRSWGHVGSPHQGRDDLAFLLAVVADAERRWPIDRRTVIAAGFSIGASMTWDLACYAAPHFTAFLPMSGGFWDPLPAACKSGPVVLRQTHGLHDSMFPINGRPILNGRFRQGDVLRGMERWRAEDQCAPQADAADIEGALTCTRWSTCAAGGEVELCLHDGDHVMSAEMLDAGLRWALAAHPADAAR